MRFQKFINEALKPSQFRMYVKGWNKEYLKELFDGKYRIYLEMHQVKQENPQPSDIQKRVARQLEPDFYIENYIAGLCKKRGDDKNLYKIGKVLTKIMEPGASLIERFANDPIRQASKKTSVMVVISRHPYDIAGMSTDRGWTSCMTLPGDKENPEGGQNCDYVEGEIKDGAIIAYLVNKNDPNITKPIARMLIKSYYNEDDPSKKILVSGNMYGTDISGFKETVDAWLDKQAKDVGIYSLGYNSYQDSGFNGTITVGTSQQIVELLKKRISQFGTGIYRDLDIFVHTQILPLFKKFEYIKDPSFAIESTGFEKFLQNELQSNQLNKRKFISVIQLIKNNWIIHYLNTTDSFISWIINNAFVLNTYYYIDSLNNPGSTVIQREKNLNDILYKYHVSQQRKDELTKIFKVIYLGE